MSKYFLQKMGIIIIWKIFWLIYTSFDLYTKVLLL